MDQPALLHRDRRAEGSGAKHWTIELGSTSILQRGGWKFSTIKKGDKITAVVGPLRNGEPGSLLVRVTLPDGRVLGNGGGATGIGGGGPAARGFAAAVGGGGQVTSHESQVTRPGRNCIRDLAGHGARRHCTARPHGAVARAAEHHRRVGAVQRRARRGPGGGAAGAGADRVEGAYAKQYEARRQADAEATKRGEPPVSDAVLCSPYGMPRMMAVATYPVEFLQTPGQITIVTEAFSEVRRVFMDQPQQPIDEVPPGYYGHSVGRWENGTLLIDTVGIKTTVPGYQNVPHSDQMRITERIRLVAPDVLHDQITISDPVVLEKPVVYTLAYRRMPGYKMVEFVCENNREYVDEQGKVRMRLAQPLRSGNR